MSEKTGGTWDPALLGELPPEMRDLANFNWEKFNGWYKGRLYGTGPLAHVFGSEGSSGAGGSSRRRSRPAATRSDAAETEQLRQQLLATQQELHATKEEVKGWRADHAKVLRRQELMYNYFKNKNIFQDDEEDQEEHQQSEESEESDGSF